MLSLSQGLYLELIKLHFHIFKHVFGFIFWHSLCDIHLSITHNSSISEASASVLRTDMMQLITHEDVTGVPNFVVFNMQVIEH